MSVRLKNNNDKYRNKDIEKKLVVAENEKMYELLLANFISTGDYLNQQMALGDYLASKDVEWVGDNRVDTTEIVVECQRAIGQYKRVLYCLRRYLRERIEDCNFDGLIAGPGIDEYYEIDKKIVELAKRFNCEVGNGEK